MSIERDSILLVLPVGFRRSAGPGLLFEKQACNGLERWADHFGKVVVACPLEPGGPPGLSGTAATVEYLEVDSLPSRARIEPIPLPFAYRLGQFLKCYRETRATLARAIGECEYLSFAIGGLVGDWASVAALEAIRQGRKYSIWTDRVEHMVIRSSHLDSSGLRRSYLRIKNNWIKSPLMKPLERHLIGHSALGLFHGRDCFDAYSPHCREPRLVHDIHLKPGDRIPPEQLLAKVERVRAGGPIRLVYAGRMAEMKGPFDWIRAMAGLRDRKVDFRATWIGDGPLLAEARAEIERLGLGDRVELPGFVGDRTLLLQALRDSDLFVFCHKTPESPRCLIESLMSATPIIGYDRSYPRDLLEDLAGRFLVPLDDEDALVDRIAAIDADRPGLASAAEKCDELGSHYSDEAVFRHRSELIKEFA